MAIKTVEFLRVDLYDSYEKLVDNKKVKKIMEDIIDEYCLTNQECKSLDLSPELSPEEIEPKKILDIFDDDMYLFGRISKKNQEMLS